METTNKSLWNYYLDSWYDYAKFSGRARRKQYWAFVLFSFVFAFGIMLPLIACFALELYVLAYILYGLYAIFGLVSMIPGISVTVRRLHDLGKGGGWYFLNFVPLVGSIVILVWACTEGEKQTNRFGEDPKALEHNLFNQASL